jgi:flagellar biogenesis protein FliO
MRQFCQTEIKSSRGKIHFRCPTTAWLLLAGIWTAILCGGPLSGQHFEGGMQNIRNAEPPSRFQSNPFFPTAQSPAQEMQEMGEMHSQPRADWETTGRLAEPALSPSRPPEFAQRGPFSPPAPWGTENPSNTPTNSGSASIPFRGEQLAVTTIPVTVGNRIPTKIPQALVGEAAPATPSGFSWAELVPNLLAQAQLWLGRGTGTERAGGGVDLKRVLVSLAIVLGVYFGLVFLVRSFTPASHQPLPSDVVQVLGRTPMSNKQTLQLVKLGNRVLLLLESAEGIQPIAEVSDAKEVEQLISLCQNPRTRNRQRSRIKAGPESTPATPASLAHALPSLPSFSAIPSIPSIPNLNQNSTEIESAIQQSLANIVRSIEVATRNASSPRVNSYEA